MKNFADRRPRLSLPFTIIRDENIVRLVAGEDFRYTLSGQRLGEWLPSLLAGINGRTPVNELIQGVDGRLRAEALKLIERLYGERILVDGIAGDTHAANKYRIEIKGEGRLCESLARAQSAAENLDALTMPVLCQDRLDYNELLQFNRQALKGASPWLWAGIGAMSRGFVGPICLPDAGPCLACLIEQFKRLSPAPEIYDELVAHAAMGRSIEPAPFPADGIEIIVRLILWKVSLMNQKDPPVSLYRLHVLEVDSMEVTSHRVFVDPECPQCGDGD
jgi:bacteriocin biosynthesis cyclodehydratase domain-containing protein